MKEFDTYEEALEYAKAHHDGSFDGQNCDDELCEWDGEDRRCNCGNRRVCWENDAFQQGKFFLVARAY